MICSAKSWLTEDLCVVQKEEFFNNMLYVRYVSLTKGQASERMLYKDYDRKEKKTLVVILKGLDAKTN
jgi:hypothetical protein